MRSPRRVGWRLWQAREGGSGGTRLRAVTSEGPGYGGMRVEQKVMEEKKTAEAPAWQPAVRWGGRLGVEVAIVLLAHE